MGPPDPKCGLSAESEQDGQYLQRKRGPETTCWRISWGGGGGFLPPPRSSSHPRPMAAAAMCPSLYAQGIWPHHETRWHCPTPTPGARQASPELRNHQWGRGDDMTSTKRRQRPEEAGGWLVRKGSHPKAGSDPPKSWAVKVRTEPLLCTKLCPRSFPRHFLI